MSGVPLAAPRPDHTCAAHPAGTRTCWNRHGCRCRECCDATTAYRKRQEAGHTRCIPVTFVQSHIGKLYAAGMNHHDMQRAGGVSETIFRDVATGRVQVIQKTTAQRILATRPGGQLATPSIGAARRLRALAVNGWGIPALVPLSGMNRARLNDLRRTKSATIPVADHATIADLYDRLWNVHAPVDKYTKRTRTVAAQHGWAPAAAWDETGPHGIDNPDATPVIGKDSKRHDLGEIEWLIRTCSNPQEIAERCGYTDPATQMGSFYKLLLNRGRLDLWQRMTRGNAA